MSSLTKRDVVVLVCVAGALFILIAVSALMKKDVAKPATPVIRPIENAKQEPEETKPEQHQTMLKSGFIFSGNGKKCWYSQSTTENEKYLFGNMTANTSHLVFDDANCMGNDDTDRMMVNNIVTKWYSLSDADFDTVSPTKASGLQKKGYCIQSKKYPNASIAVDYLTDPSKKHIREVVHSQGLPCELK